MAINATVAHQIPGRVRLVVREMRGDAAYFSGLSEKLSRLDNVQSARTNPTTGSVVLEFMGSLNALLQRARDDDVLLALAPVANQTSKPTPRAATPFNLVSGREINRMYMIGCALVVIGIIQVARGELYPPALSVFWVAAEAFRLSGHSQRNMSTEADGVRRTPL